MRRPARSTQHGWAASGLAPQVRVCVATCGAVGCSVMQCGALRSVVQCGAVWCSVVQCGAVCCSVLQCVSVCCFSVCCSVPRAQHYAARQHGLAPQGRVCVATCVAV